MRYLQKIIVVKAIIISICLLGCVTEKAALHKEAAALSTEEPDYVRRTGAKQKDTLFIFTGSDWSAEQEVFVKNIVNPSVLEKLEEIYTVCHIDLPRNTANHDEEKIKKNYVLFAEYIVQDVPYLVIQTDKQDVYVGEVLEKNITEAAFFEKIASYAPMRTKVVQARALIGAAEGAAKAKAIDSFLLTVKNATSRRYDALRMDVPRLDPENSSGLKGKYLLMSTDIHAKGLVQAGKFIQAGDEYKKLAETEKLNDFEAQTAWYLAAYLYIMSGKVETSIIIDYLEKAIQAAPEHEGVKYIKQTINKLQEKKKK